MSTAGMSRTVRFFIIVSLVALCAGCNGGSSSDGTAATENAITEGTDTTITGVAAAGAPIAGLVYVKGANGKVASSTIGTDGSYSLDVTDITAPYILCAEGSVKGRSIKLYSAWTTTGTINITPVTDFIIRNALRGSPETAYLDWGSVSTMQAAISDAERDVEKQLAPVLDAAGVPTQVDLITSPFSADGTGLDAALEAIDISYNGNTARVTNVYTGTYYKDDITQAGDSDGFPESEAASMQAVLADAQSISALFNSLEDLYATSVPAAQALQAWFAAHVSADFLSRGMDRNQMLDMWLDGGPAVGCNYSAAIIDAVTPAAPYTRAYRVGITYAKSGESIYFINYMVYDGTKWLWQGDQMWGSFEIRAHATWFIDSMGLPSYCTTGFEFSVGVVKSGLGVGSVFVTGPGLPSGGVIFQNNYPDEDFTIYGTTGVYHAVSDDDLLSSIPDNAEYEFSLCSDTAAELSRSGTASAHVLKVYKDTVMKRPVLNRELNASMFAMITGPTSHDIADLDFGSEATVTWTAPANTRPGETAILFYDSGNQVWISDDNEDGNDSATLDLIGFVAPDWATIFIRVIDQNERHYNFSWGFVRQ